MRNEAFYLIIGICGFMYGTISVAYNNLEYKGYSSAHSCTGDCYVKYVEENGTPAQIEQKKRELASTDEFSSIRGTWAGCAACHGPDGGGGVGPKLAGQGAEYIIDKLTIYKNKGEVGPMSAMMWGQASNLSDTDIQTIGKFIQETMNE